MASGVEMLGQMSETEALAGPVQGGNMVVKPNEVPVGGAAMLAKALRGQANKGIGGIYELPSQKAPTPEFMQMAQANVDRDIFRGMGPRKGMTPFDIANMEGAAEQAGIMNFLGFQPEVTVPIRAKSHADAPPTQLAYITDAEKQMLLNANMHGSLEGNQPNQGPAGVQSLDDYYNLPGGGVGGGSGQQVFDSGVDIPQGGAGGDSSQSGGYQSSEAYGINPGMAVGEGGQVWESVQDDVDEEQGFDQNEWKKVSAAKQKELEEIAKAKEEEAKSKVAEGEGNLLSKLTDKEKANNEKNMKTKKWVEKQIAAEQALGDKSDKKRLKELQNRLKTVLKDLGQSENVFSDMLSSSKDKALKKLKELGIFGNEIKDIKDLPKETQDEMMKLLENFERVHITPEEAMSPLMTTLKHMGSGLERLDEDGNVIGDTLEGLTKKLRALDTDGGASVLESLKKYRPELYYKAYREPQSTGALANFGRNTLAVKDSEGNYTIDGRKISNEDAKRYNNAIFSARERTRDEGSNNQYRRPGVMQDTIAEEVIETPDGVIDEEAQTMKYISPRTGDKEIDVPLQRRFKTDPTQDVAQFTKAPRTESDILKYMTQGTTGEGIDLEPFSEYQKRRRKAMGLDPLELYG
jgi:hypothetical protein